MVNRYFRYCSADKHTEDTFHLIGCPDVYDEEKNKILAIREQSDTDENILWKQWEDKCR